MLESIDKRVLEKMEIQKAECEQRLAFMSETVDKLVQEKMKIHRKEYEQKLVAMRQTVDQHVQEKAEIHRKEFEQKLVAMRQTVDQRVQEKAEEKARMVQKVAALEMKNLKLEQAARAMSAEHESRLTNMSMRVDSLVLANREESMESRGNLATMSKKIDLLFRERSWDTTTVESAGFITVGPTASGSHNPSSVQSNRSGQQPQPSRAWCEEQTAAQGSSTVSQLQEIQKAECEQRPAVMSGTVDKLVQEKMEEKAECQQNLEGISRSIYKRVREKMEIQKAECEQRLAVMSETVDKLVQEKMEEKAKCQQKLVDVSKYIYKRVREKMEIQETEFEQRLDLMSETIDKLILENMEIKAEFLQKLADMSESMDKRVLEITKGKAKHEQKLVAMSKTIEKLIQEKTEEFEQKLDFMSSLVLAKEEESLTIQAQLATLSESVNSLLLEKRLGSMEFQEKPATVSEKMDSPLLMTTQEKTTAESVGFITVGPTASGCHNPSSVQSNSSSGGRSNSSSSVQSNRSCSVESNRSGSVESNRWGSVESNRSGSVESNRSEQLKSQQPQPDRAWSEEQTAAQGSSSVSQLQQEVRLPPTEQSLKKKKGKTQHCEEPEETSDERLLDPDLAPELTEAFMLLNSDDGTKIINGLELIAELAQYQREVVIPKVEEVCVVILREVLNPWETMSQAALMTLSELLSILKKHFNPYLDWVVNALLQKAASDIIIQEAANAALHQMILYCDPTCCAEALLNGLSNQRTRDPGQEAAVRECVATHLLSLVEAEGHWLLFGSEEEMKLRLLTTVRDLTQDASELVRCCAEEILSILET